MLSLQSAVDGTTYQWLPSMYLSSDTGTTPTIQPITTQTYTVIGTTPQGCKDTINFTATVHPAALLSIPDSITLYSGASYTISPGTNCTSFFWFPPAGLSDVHVSNPVATPEISTKYIVYGATEFGCTTVDSINIYVSQETQLAIPNAFRPGSGGSSEFKIIKLGVANLNYFRIFNRWGNKVFETTDIDKGWNGEFNGTPQPFGVYIYEVQAVTEAGKIVTQRGNMTLLR